MPSISHATPADPAKTEAGLAVVFEKVSFAFDEHVVLEDLSFVVPKRTARVNRLS